MKSWRLTLILGFVSILYVALGWRVYNLQILQNDYYLSRAQAREGGAGSYLSNRGTIYFTDRSGNRIPAVLNKEFPVAFAVPSDIKYPNITADEVSEIFDMDREDLVSAFSKTNDPYEPLKDKLTESEIKLVSAMDSEGVYIRNQTFRFYQFDKLASHVLGFVGPSDLGSNVEGKYGVELVRENYLKNGEEVELTIDRDAQARVERILGGLMEDFSAEGGTIIVMEPETGKIVAMGSYPNFDPNNYFDSEVGSFLNPAVQAVYEPGSVFKPITMAIGIDTEAITPETTFYDPGELTLNGHTIKNWDLKAYGKVTMTEVIERSINTGAAFAARQIGREPFYDYLVKFGFDRKTSVELPGEVVGNLSNLTNYPRDINYATASYGQGVSVTPIALISAFSAIANDGIMMKPYILNATGPQALRRVVKRDSANKVTNMMVGAVKKANVAQIPNYTIAGKTGTAQVPGPGGYSDDFIHTFVGFAPASDPKFVALIKVDKPRGVALAGYTVVPAFRELSEFLINHYAIPPDNLALEE
jgi:stage V sporulation protein D (sporulation-specific penicillin-binding protein)